MAVSIRLGATGGEQVVEQFKKIGNEVQQLGGRFTELKGRAEELRTFSLDKFGAGRSLGGPFEILQQIRTAGGIRGFIGANGGAAGIAAMTAGAGFEQIQKFAELGDVANRAGITAQQLQGLRSIMQGLGVEARDSDSAMTTFAAKLYEARDRGGPLAETLKSLGIEMNNANGSARSSISVLGEVINKIRATEDESEKLKIATAAVGSEMADKLVTAARSAKTELGDLGTISAAAGSKMANSLAAGAQEAAKTINRIELAATGAIARIKELLGVANDAERTLAAKARNQQLLVEAEVARRAALNFDPEKGDIINKARRRNAQDRAPEITRELLDKRASEKEQEAFRSVFGVPLTGNGAWGPNPGNSNFPQPPRPTPTPPEKPDSGSSGRAAPAATKEEATNIDEVTAALQKMRNELTQTAREKFQLSQTEKLNSAATTDQIAAIREQAGAYYDLKKSMEDAKKNQDDFNTSIKEAGSGLFRAAIEGKKFDDVARNLASRLMDRAFSKFLDFALSGMGNIFGGSMFGGGASGGPLILAGGRASGGNVYAGKGYLVGERGEEYFYPKSDGVIAPANGGGGPVAIKFVNSGSPKQGTARESRGPDGSRMIEVVVRDVIMNDLGKGGDIAQGFANVYGLQRGGGQ